MTVASSVSRITVSGNSSATSFAFPFKITASSHLVVTKTTSAGITSTLTLGTHYSVSGVGSESGGSITYPLSGTALPTGDTLTMRRVVPLTQTTDLTNQGAFYAEVHETEFDYLTYIAQQLTDQLTDLDAVVDGLIGDTPGSLRAYTFTGDGGTVLFSLGVTLTGGVRSVLVAVDGVIQGIETYAVSGTSLIFSEAPPYGAAIDVRAIGEASSVTLADTSAVTATGSTASRLLSDRFSDYPNLKNWGATGDGVTDDTVAVNAAEAATAKTIYVPEGTYITSLGQSALHKTYVGPGQIKTGTSKRGPRYSDVTAAPSATGTHSSVVTAFNGDWSNTQFAIEHRITGSTTLTQPTATYVYTPEAYPHYTYLYNESGYNHQTASNEGRTAACAYRVKVFQAGQGDAVAYNASAFVTGTKASSTHFLANPAASLWNGDMTAGADGVYLNAGEMVLTDAGFDVAGIGWVVNMVRTNITAAKSAMWCGLRIQGKGSQLADAALSVYAKVKTGLDFVTSEGIQAVVMKAGQRIYGNGTNSDVTTFSAGATSSGTSYLGYDATLVGWEVVAGGTRTLGVTASGVDITLKSYTVATLPSAATHARGLIYVSDGTSNKRLAISDGTNWRFPDGNVVS